MGKISDALGIREIRKNFIGLFYNNTNTEAGFLYRYYHHEKYFYYRLNHPADWRKGRLNKLRFFEYWLRLKGYTDNEIIKIQQELISRNKINSWELMDPKTLYRYKKNKLLNECYYELMYQRNVRLKDWETLRCELLEDDKELDRRLYRALKLTGKLHEYLKKNPHATSRELQRKFSIRKPKLEATLKTLGMSQGSK